MQTAQSLRYGRGQEGIGHWNATHSEALSHAKLYQRCFPLSPPPRWVNSPLLSVGSAFTDLNICRFLTCGWRASEDLQDAPGSTFWSCPGGLPRCGWRHVYPWRDGHPPHQWIGSPKCGHWISLAVELGLHGIGYCGIPGIRRGSWNGFPVATKGLWCPSFKVALRTLSVYCSPCKWAGLKVAGSRLPTKFPAQQDLNSSPAIPTLFKRS